MVQALCPDEQVNICVNDARAGQQVQALLVHAGVDMSRVRLYEIPTNDAWARDHCPIFVTRQISGQIADQVADQTELTELGLTDWLFNTWGGKYPPWDSDNAVPRHIATHFGMPRFEPGLVLEGGSIDVNGCGTLLTTESCLLHPNRNPELSREDIEAALKASLGIQKILWLGDGIAGDDTDGHVDDIVRFVNPTTVVCAVEEDPHDMNYRVLQDNWARLQRMTDQDGQPLRVVPLPMPGPVVADDGRLPASYANFYIANSVVLVPTYAHANDQRALTILQDCFPTRRVVGIPCTDLVLGLGAIHCVTMQQPAADRVWQKLHVK
jgi:agmatine deiminase